MSLFSFIYISHSLPQPPAAKLKPPAFQKKDPSLSVEAPKPTKQLCISSSFGFQPEVHALDTQTNHHPGPKTSVIKHQEPPPSYQSSSGDALTKGNHQKQLSWQAQHLEVVSDSEEDDAKGGGQDYYNEEGGKNREDGDNREHGDCKGNLTIEHNTQILAMGIQSILDKYNTAEVCIPCKRDPKRKL